MSFRRFNSQSLLISWLGPKQCSSQQAGLSGLSAAGSRAVALCDAPDLYPAGLHPSGLLPEALKVPRVWKTGTCWTCTWQRCTTPSLPHRLPAG